MKGWIAKATHFCHVESLSDWLHHMHMPCESPLCELRLTGNRLVDSTREVFRFNSIFSRRISVRYKFVTYYYLAWMQWWYRDCICMMSNFSYFKLAMAIEISRFNSKIPCDFLVADLSQDKPTAMQIGYEVSFSKCYHSRICPPAIKVKASTKNDCLSAVQRTQCKVSTVAVRYILPRLCSCCMPRQISSPGGLYVWRDGNNLGNWA